MFSDLYFGSVLLAHAKATQLYIFTHTAGTAIPIFSPFAQLQECSIIVSRNQTLESGEIWVNWPVGWKNDPTPYIWHVSGRRCS